MTKNIRPCCNMPSLFCPTILSSRQSTVTTAPAVLNCQQVSSPASVSSQISFTWFSVVPCLLLMDHYSERWLHSLLVLASSLKIGIIRFSGCLSTCPQGWIDWDLVVKGQHQCDLAKQSQSFIKISKNIKRWRDAIIYPKVPFSCLTEEQIVVSGQTLN